MGQTAARGLPASLELRAQVQPGEA